MLPCQSLSLSYGREVYRFVGFIPVVYREVSRIFISKDFFYHNIQCQMGIGCQRTLHKLKRPLNRPTYLQSILEGLIDYMNKDVIGATLGEEGKTITVEFDIVNLSSDAVKSN